MYQKSGLSDDAYFKICLIHPNELGWNLELRSGAVVKGVEHISKNLLVNI